MGLETFVDRLSDDGPDRSLVVATPDSPELYGRMLEELVGDDRVAVDRVADGVDVDDADGRNVLLVEDGTVVASSPLARLEEAVLLTNSDAYRTGLTGFDDGGLPEVLAGLDDVPFELRGWPAAQKEKLLLIAVSRHIEQLARDGGGGTLRSSFQRLSRLRDERGTERVYRQLAETTAVHVYGVPDWVPPAEFDVVAHGGYTDDFERSWFVVYRPDGGGRAAALVAVERGPNDWVGFWTYREPLIADIAEYVAYRL